jgi:hypothetical protein
MEHGAWSDFCSIEMSLTQASLDAAGSTWRPVDGCALGFVIA